MTRKEFLAGTAAFAASFTRPVFAKSPDEIRAVLLHMGMNMWGEWRAERMQVEVKRLKQMGLEPIPKMNFSATHHQWLKEYSRMLSTRPYYQVCSDIIKDVSEIFGRPRFRRAVGKMYL